MTEFEIFSRFITSGSKNIPLGKMVFREDGECIWPLHFDEEFDSFFEELYHQLDCTTYEIEKQLYEIGDQFHRLRFLTRVSKRTTSLDKLIYKSSNGFLNHVNFHHTSGIKNSKKKYSESEFQEYYSCMKDGCAYLLSFLDDLRKDVESTHAGRWNTKRREAPQAYKRSFSISRNPQNIQKLKKIYNLEFGHKKFIGSDTTEEDFLNYFTSQDVCSSKVKIITACEANVAGYIIKLMQSLFSGLRFNLIEKSEGIIKKSGRPLTANHISSANSKIKNSSGFPNKYEIDTFFRDLNND